MSVIILRISRRLQRPVHKHSQCTCSLTLVCERQVSNSHFSPIRDAILLTERSESATACSHPRPALTCMAAYACFGSTASQHCCTPKIHSLPHKCRQFAASRRSSSPPAEAWSPRSDPDDRRSPPAARPSWSRSRSPSPRRARSISRSNGSLSPGSSLGSGGRGGYQGKHFRDPPPNWRGPADRNSDLCTVYVGGLPIDTTQEDVFSHFGKYGEVIKVRMIKDHETQVRSVLCECFRCSECICRFCCCFTRRVVVCKYRYSCQATPAGLFAQHTVDRAVAASSTWQHAAQTGTLSESVDICCMRAS